MILEKSHIRNYASMLTSVASKEDGIRRLYRYVTWPNGKFDKNAKDSFAAYDGVNHTFDSIEIDTTLTCGNDTGVAPLSVSPEGEKTAVYDLQGRRLNAKPQRGLYIQGGKMRMAW